MAAAAAIAAVGTVVTVAGQLQASKAQREAAEASAASKRFQADEILNRFEINSAVMRRDQFTTQAKQAAAYVHGGVDVGSGTTLLMLEDTARKISDQLIMDEKEAQYKANVLRQGGEVDERLGSEIRKAGQISAFGSFLSGSYSTYRAGTK